MREQTDKLIASVPALAPLFSEADIYGGHNWRIVRWENVPPSEVTAEQIRVLKTVSVDGKAVANEFSSRTAALRMSEKVCRGAKEVRSEKGHWGVWKIPTGNKVLFQSVLPVRRVTEEGKVETEQQARSKAKKKPEVVGEVKTDKQADLVQAAEAVENKASE